MNRYQNYPDISDVLAQKARGREERSSVSFGEKLEILEKLREQAAPIARAREERFHTEAA